MSIAEKRSWDLYHLVAISTQFDKRAHTSLTELDDDVKLLGLRYAPFCFGFLTLNFPS